MQTDQGMHLLLLRKPARRSKRAFESPELRASSHYVPVPAALLPLAFFGGMGGEGNEWPHAHLVLSERKSERFGGGAKNREQMTRKPEMLLPPTARSKEPCRFLILF